MVHRFVVAVLALASLLAVAPVVADAGPTKSVSYTLSGSAEWGAVYQPPSFAVSGDVLDGKATVGTYSGTLLAGAYVGCPDNPFGPNCAPVTGTITFDLRGGSITATVDPGGLVWEAFTGASHDEYVFRLSLSITSGTHAYARAQGTLSLEYDSSRFNQEIDPVTGAYCASVDITSCPIGDAGTLTGTISR
jgi:hypothetical protein